MDFDPPNSSQVKSSQLSQTYLKEKSIRSPQAWTQTIEDALQWANINVNICRIKSINTMLCHYNR